MNKEADILVVDDIEVNGMGSINYLTDLYKEVHEIHITVDDEDDARELEDPHFREFVIEDIQKGRTRPKYSLFKVITMGDKKLVGYFKRLEPAIARAANYEHEYDRDVAIVLIHYYQI